MSVLIAFTTVTPNSTGPVLRIRKKDNTEYYMNPSPTLGFGSTPVIQGDTLLGWEHSVTLNCFAIPSGTASERSAQLLSCIASVTNFFEESDELRFYNSANQSQPEYIWPIVNPAVSVDDSNFYSAVRFNIQFTGFSTNMNGSTSGIPLQSFSDTFNYEPDSSLGFDHNDSSAAVYRFSRTVSAQARPPTQAYLNESEFLVNNAASGAKAFVDARLGINPVNAADDFIYNQNIALFNLTKSVNIDLGQLSYSVTLNGLYASGVLAEQIKNSGAFETYSTSIQRDANSPIVNVTVDGALTGYARGAVNDSDNVIRGTAGAGAAHVLHQISNNTKFNAASTVFKRAQKATGEALNPVPKSISIADSTLSDNRITYNVQYDNRPLNIVSGAISEIININDTYPTDVYASIQIPGKRNGPVFQYMNTTTHFERDVSIEVVLDSNKLGVGQSYSSLIGYKPSVDSNTRSVINGIINELMPTSTTYCLVKSCTESWSPKEGKYAVNVGWIYK